MGFVQSCDNQLQLVTKTSKCLLLKAVDEISTLSALFLCLCSAPKSMTRAHSKDRRSFAVTIVLTTPGRNALCRLYPLPYRRTVTCAVRVNHKTFLIGKGNVNSRRIIFLFKWQLPLTFDRPAVLTSPLREECEILKCLFVSPSTSNCAIL